MDLFTAMKISASGMYAERVRLNVAAMNLANAHVTRTLDGGPYRAKSVVFQEIPLSRETENNQATFQQNLDSALSKVRVQEIVDDKEPFMEVFDPSHPDADRNGIVKLPNVNVMEQMVDIMAATRAYEANVTLLESAKTMALKTLELAR